MLMLKGTVVDLEQRSGTSDKGPYAYVELSVRDDESQVFWKLRVGDNFGVVPLRGDIATMEVTARAFRRSGGDAAIGLTAVRPLEVITPNASGK